MSDFLRGRLIHAGRDALRGVLHLLYPGTCAVCGLTAPLERPNLCDSCRASLTSDTQPTCPRCAGTVGPHVDRSNGCTHCCGESFPFECVFRLGYYDGLLRDVILRMKNAPGEMLAEILGELWAEHLAQGWQSLGADVVIPVPLHWWRRLKRGYNQSSALARALATRLGLPCKPSWLRRVRYTPHQMGLSGADRRQNLKGAFRANPWAKLRGKSVLLLDDVLTTGTTACEATRTLHAAGATRVLVAVLARSHS